MSSMSAKSFQIALEAATNEKNSEENWDRILEVCDYIKNGRIKPKELLEQILKRLKQARKTKLQMNTLTLFDAAVQNCGQIFHQLFTSRSTMNLLIEIIENPKTENIVRNRIGLLLKQWMENPIFKDEPQYGMIKTTYQKLTTEKGYTFIDIMHHQPISVRKTDEELLTKREEEEFAKAVAVSMQKVNQPKSQQPIADRNEKKVKALYDFEAAEDNEVTFKAGDILIITDDSDQHWWKGINNGIEGLFPANFVTENLQQQVDTKTANEQEHENKISNDRVIIDECLINRSLIMLQNTDPTGEIVTDLNEMFILENSCYSMGPLIDHELKKFDRKHMELQELNNNLREVMDLYYHLMEEGRLRAISQQQQPIAHVPPGGVYPDLHQHMMHSISED